MRKRPIYPIQPGEILAGELAEQHKSPTALARELHIPANRISQLIAGRIQAGITRFSPGQTPAQD